jgi:hypothetical protein
LENRGAAIVSHYCNTERIAVCYTCALYIKYQCMETSQPLNFTCEVSQAEFDEILAPKNSNPSFHAVMKAYEGSFLQRIFVDQT